MKETNAESVRAKMRAGMLEFCTMLIIERGKAYTSDILRELKSADLLVVEGTLYPLLSRLRAQGLLAHEWEESKSGPPRKYFSLTTQGHMTLQESKAAWKELIGSIATLLK